VVYEEFKVKTAYNNDQRGSGLPTNGHRRIDDHSHRKRRLQFRESGHDASLTDLKLLMEGSGN